MWARVLGNEAIIAMVGHEAFARGMVYARNGKVVDVEVDTEAMAVTGRVLGGYRDGYRTSVQLLASADGWTGHQGRCACPVAQDCKHTAALLIVARGVLAENRRLERPAWERSLDRIVERSAPDPDDTVEVGLELGVERVVAFRGSGTRCYLRMRPVRRGSTGRWVRSGIGWDELDYGGHRIPPEHADLLLQLRGAAGAAARFRLPKSPWLGLGEVAAGWWALLRRAADLGLPVMGEEASTEPLVATAPARLVLDARRSAGDLTLVPTLLLHEQPLPAGTWGLIGDPVHGVFRHTPELTLARLSTPLSRELRRVVDDTPVVVPAEDEHRFGRDFLPRLRRHVPVLSLDGSVTLPDLVRPVPHLTVGYRPERRVRLDWAVGYGEQPEHRFPLDEDLLAPLRDRKAEDAALAALPLPYGAMPALAGERPGRPAGHALLAGVDAAVFVAQVLPALRDLGVVVLETGEPVGFRLADAAPEVQLAARPTRSADWFDLHVTVRVDGETVPFEDLFVALSRGEEFVVLESGVYVPVQRPEFHRLQDLIGEARQLAEVDGSRLRINRVQTDLWSDLLGSGLLIEQSAHWTDAVGRLVTGSDPPEPEPDPPPTLRAELRPYQVEGFRWLCRLWRHRLGGVLADDMGLGKTLQALALLTHARAAEPGAPPFLVVAPTSVISTWAGEAARFAPDLRVVVLDQTQAKAGRALAAAVGGADVVLTSYALLRIDADAYADLTWAGAVLDEAQFVKNHRSRTYHAARRLRAPTKIAVTGTPLENSLMDLWSLFSITAPGLFGQPERFAEYYRRPIERDHDADRLAQLRRRVRPLMLRRTKERVAAELPAKQEQVLDIVLQPRHQRVYQTYLQRERQKVLGLITDLEGNRFTILRSLTTLRQLALDPGLVDARHAGVPATKIEVLTEMLAELVSEGHQAVVFSQFTGFLHRIAQRLKAEGIGHTLLEGRTRHRDRVIEEFRSGAAPVFLISLKAGGFGLNLTEADYCFLLDPWWNPASEAQAVDRTHRIGQQRRVMVYRLVASGTIEEKVMELKQRKARLFDAVMSGDALSGLSLDESDIREILSLPQLADTA